LLHANGRQLIDVKKTAVINFFSGNPLIRQSIGLMTDQMVENIEAARKILNAIE
jgi:hypothetical protein